MIRRLALLAGLLAAAPALAQQGPFPGVATPGGGLSSGGTINGDLTVNGDLSNVDTLEFNHLDRSVTTIAADDTTPDVSATDFYVTSTNTVPTAITDLDNPIVGSYVTIYGDSTDDTNDSTISPSATNFTLMLGAITLDPGVSITFRVNADNDYRETARSTPHMNLQSFIGAGSYTWYAPKALTMCTGALFSGGHAGAGGGFDTSDSGGGGGAAGVVLLGQWPISAMGASQAVTIGAGGVAAAAKAAAGDGLAPSSVPGPSSFGSLLAVTPNTTGDPVGGGATNGAGGAVENAWTSITAPFYITGNAGGDGEDTVAGVAPTATVLVPFGPFLIVPPVGGGGGGGQSSGSAFTRGSPGASQKSVFSNSTAAALSAGTALVAATTQAANSDGSDGNQGAAGGFSNGALIGGQGATGGSGAIVTDTNGGDGKVGGANGGGGSGGGGKKADAGNEAGQGGNGGAAALYVWCQ